MFLSSFSLEPILLLLGGALTAGTLEHLAKRRQRRRETALWEARLQKERSAGEHLCLSTLEALAYAIEARDRFQLGHLARVQRGVDAICRALELPAEEVVALRAATLLHNIGRLGVPEYILQKPEALTPEEQEKLRSHPVLGARILASIPFPWIVVPIVRHHAENWDGTGYPDGLLGSDIPFGARILAVASAYSALQQPRPYRPAFSPTEALAEIEARAGTQFDPAVVNAFRTVAAEIRAEIEKVAAANAVRADEAQSDARESTDTKPSIIKPADRSVADLFAPIPERIPSAYLYDIAAAQRETHNLYRLGQAVNETLHLEAVCDTLLECTREMVSCAACALFLPDEEDDMLRAQAAIGINARHLLGSVTRVGTYLTGRAFSRGEIVQASYLPDDLLLRNVSDLWTPFRSTLIVPLIANGCTVGTLNLYAEEPEAFGAEALRLMRLVAMQASRALDNARRFASVQETAYTDPMTGLRNARFLREFLEKEINRSHREQMTLAVLNIDVDNFKPINDRMGHARGDQTLREIASILNAHVRNYDLAARYAGDEFVVVLAQADRVNAQNVAAKLKVAVDRHTERLIAREPEFPQLGISVGIAVYPEDGQNLQNLLCTSDAAMYRDKQERRGGKAPAVR